MGILDELNKHIEETRKKPVDCLCIQCGYNLDKKCMSIPIIDENGECISFYASKIKLK